MKDNIFTRQAEREEFEKRDDETIEYDGTLTNLYSSSLAHTIQPPEPMTYNFNDQNGDPILTLVATGDILVRGRFVENDKEVVDALRHFIQVRKF